MGKSILFCYICPVLAKVVPQSKQNPKLNQSARMERSKKEAVSSNPAKVIFIRTSPISKGWAVACSASILCILTEWVKEGPHSLKQQSGADIPGRTCNWFFNIHGMAFLPGDTEDGAKGAKLSMATCCKWGPSICQVSSTC